MLISLLILDVTFCYDFAKTELMSCSSAVDHGFMESAALSKMFKYIYCMLEIYLMIS